MTSTMLPTPKKTREEAREYYTKQVASQRAHLADPRAFSTIDPNYIIRHSLWCLRWIDCAPEGARHQLAPLQDKKGVPCGDAWNENLGPGRNLREAYAARGFHPLGGAAHRAMNPEV